MTAPTADIEATAAVEHVRQATVHIRSKRLTGTGFFVDRNIILTCAHVLARGHNQVQIRVQDRVVGGTVLKRLPETGRPGAAYPFPDIAFIGVDGNIDHPIAEARTLFLRNRENQDAKIAAFGFNRHAPEPDRGPDIVRMAVQGPSGSFVKAHTQVGVAPGMSGAPVVDVSTGLVCGMLKYYVDDQDAAWFIDALDFGTELDRYRTLLGRFEPRKPKLFLPEPHTPLWNMLNAQRRVAEELPYQVVEGEVPLSTVYVEQRAEAWLAERQRAAAWGGPAPLEPAVIPATEMLTRHRNALVVSGPGGGKSTLLQHLVAESAAWWLQPDQPGEGAEPSFGPAIAIRCAATRLLTGRPWYDSVADAVNADLHGYLPTALVPALFQRPPRPGVDWLILVDGLDEIFNPRKRSELIKRLAVHIATYGQQARFVVSSRILAAAEFSGLRSLTTGVDRTQRLGEYNLRPFDRPAVESFAGRWYQLREPAHAVDRQRSFLHQVDKNRMMPMVRIPLLCTIAADVHQQSPEESLPYGRAGLYRRFVDALLKDRQTFPDVRTKVREQLRDLGAEAEAFGETLFSRRLQCLVHLAEQRMARDRQPSVELVRAWLDRTGTAVPDDITDQHIREVLVSTGLIVNRGDGLEFTHQSIAEFLYGRDRGRFLDPQKWLARVTLAGLTSADMFELAAWTDAGNDPTDLIVALAEPGPDRQYPQLTQLADLLADGAATTDDGTTIAAITMEAVQEAAVEPAPVLQAINQAARAVLQRAPDPSPLIDLINDAAMPEPKRIEVATVLLADGDLQNRQHGLRVLRDLGYSAQRTIHERLPALRALAESGNSSERRSAVQHLASLVATGKAAHLRVLAADVLIGVGEPAEAVAALTARLASHDLGSRDLQTMNSEVQALEDLTRQWVATEGGEPAAEPHRSRPAALVAPWSAPRRIQGAAGRAKVDALWGVFRSLAELAGRVPPDRLDASIAVLTHDRSTDWAVRSEVAGSLYVSGLGHAAIDRLLDDTGVSVTRRLIVWYSQRHGQDPAGADAMLRSIVRNDRATGAARSCALNTLGTRGGRAGAAFLATAARDPALSPAVRVEAAAVLGRRTRHRDEAIGVLDELMRDPALGRRWRWAAHGARLATALEPATVYLTRGRTLDNAITLLIWEPVDHLRTQIRKRIRREPP